MADARTGEKRADMADDDCDSATRGKTAVAVVVATIMLEHASKNFMLLGTPLGMRRYTTPRAVARRKSGGKEAGPRVTESMSVSYAGIVPGAVISCSEFPWDVKASKRCRRQPGPSGANNELRYQGENAKRHR